MAQLVWSTKVSPDYKTIPKVTPNLLSRKKKRNPPGLKLRNQSVPLHCRPAAEMWISGQKAAEIST